MYNLNNEPNERPDPDEHDPDETHETVEYLDGSMWIIVLSVLGVLLLLGGAGYYYYRQRAAETEKAVRADQDAFVGTVRTVRPPWLTAQSSTRF